MENEMRNVQLVRNGDLSVTWELALKHLDLGAIQDRYIYMHFTDAVGFESIVLGKQLNAFNAKSLRNNASTSKVYLSPSTQRLSPEEVHTYLLLGQPAYKDRGQYVLIFSLHTHADLERKAVFAGSSYLEVIFPGKIDFVPNDGKALKEAQAVVLYAGRNRFLARTTPSSSRRC
jgi:hypothetical protein